MAINETLKFSWGHIIAFVALIFIGYVSFMGITYLTDGDFLYAGLGVLIIDLVLILFFIIPQLLKGTDEKFSRKIIFERILFFVAPVFFIVAMIPYTHFWTVFKNRITVETTFSESIRTTKGMFTSYEEYATTRIKEYDNKLANEDIQVISRTNKVEALRVQLIAENYETLKINAIEWIDKASSATVWNVFMIGNLKTIETAVESWNNSLTGFSSKIMSDEPEVVMPFTSSDPSVVIAKQNLNKLRSTFTTMHSPTLISIGLALLLYFMLLVPYLVQRRNTKSIYKLIGLKNESSDNFTVSRDENESSLNDNEYGSFTL